MTIADPANWGAYEFLAASLATENAPRDAIEEALRKRASLVPDSDRAAKLEQGTLAMALLTGDLVVAEASARRAMALAEGAQTETEHDSLTLRLIDVLDEKGDTARALAEGETFERKALAWTPDSPWGVHVRVAFMRYKAGQIDRAALRDALEALRLKGTAKGLNPAIWTLHKGWDALDAGQAAEVRAELAEAGALDFSSFPDFSADAGKVMLLTGDAAGAVAPLRVATQSCSALTVGWGDTIWWLRTHELLGEALEQTGDKTGACAAYGAVLDHWKNPKPRSVTVDKARAHATKLGCAP
jgi:hypothetical protein